MRITKYGHACVRIEHDGVRVVLDPGVFTEPEAVDDADAVLITHEHPDHLDVERLRRTAAPIHTIAAVAAAITGQAPDLVDRVHVLAPGDRIDVGLPVEAVGEKHAVIHPDYPTLDNSGYVIGCGGARVYHPGDSLTLPPGPVDLLLAPISAPWLAIGPAVDFVRAVGAPRTLGIHDKVYSDLALGMVDAHMANLVTTPLGLAFTRLPSGADLD